MQEFDNYSINQALEQAADLLRTGKLVAFPTETVYGLGADATNPQAIQAVFDLKNRPGNHPLIVHIPKVHDLEQWAINIPADALKLAGIFWPGPLTMILQKKPSVSDLITANKSTIAIRIPQHPITQALLDKFGGGIVGPSANQYGHISPTQASHVRQEFESGVDFVLNGGACKVGIESTIVDFTTNSGQPVIVRQGAISALDIAKVLGCSVSDLTPTKPTIGSPGSHPRHYAPRVPLFITDFISLLVNLRKLQSANIPTGVISFVDPPDNLLKTNQWINLSKNPLRYSQSFYASLRTLEFSQQCILIEALPASFTQNPKWQAIVDRLQRASYGTMDFEDFLQQEKESECSL